MSDLTKFPEILGGRVKTLHPFVHGGLLAVRDNPDHMAQLSDIGISPIDIVVCNLYPFEETVSKANVSLENVLENIDIGGPTMVRAAAKNFPSVTIVVDPDDYISVFERLEKSELTLTQRKELAAKAFQHVALYDTIIAQYLRGNEAKPPPEEMTLGLRKVKELRYGENPHQKGYLYSNALLDNGITSAEQLHGKELSFNNILDANSAWTTVSDFPDQAVAIIKHTNPCGLASNTDQVEAYKRALDGDSTSAYGGIVSFNRKVSAKTAEEMRKMFFEIIIAPSYEGEALDLLKKKKDLRIIEAKNNDSGHDYSLRQVSGGILVQTADDPTEDPTSWQTVTDREPTDEELQDLTFAWKAVKHIKSNAITLTKENALVGMGAGQPNRVVSVHLALRIAETKAKGSVLASDAFFPFPDGVELAAQGGITAVVQPGGSIRDKEVIEIANKYKLAMVFTGLRHFQH